jgi:hypothetical protein
MTVILTPAQRVEIHDLYRGGGWTHRALGAKFGVSAAAVCLLLRRMGVQPQRKMSSLDPNLDPYERAWAAGFFDGEGCTHAQLSNGIYRVHLSVAQNGTELLERFDRAVGLRGKIYADVSPVRKNVLHSWRINGYEGVQQTLIVLWPWLGSIKREQASRALALTRSTSVWRPRLSPEEVAWHRKEAGRRWAQKDRDRKKALANG